MITVESYADSTWAVVDEGDGHTRGWNTARALVTRSRIRVQSFLRRLVFVTVRLCAWTALAGVIVAGWWWRENLPLEADTGFGYALGVTSAVCMLVLLVYPLRKRVKWLKFIGPAKHWFFVHMCLGVAAPITALYHCGFQLGSLNSRIALTCALVVSGSGLVGRFLYRRIYSDWSGRRSVVRRMSKPKLFGARDLKFLELVSQRLAMFDRRTQAQRDTLLNAIRWSIEVKSRTRTERYVLMRFCRKQVNRAARRNPVLANERERLVFVIDRYIALRTMQSAQIARVQIYERLFALWHVAHLPFFFLLLVSVVVHVFAVHLY